ncbi:MAG: SMP-30/gluconolactonase/LRE family protein, partial [Gemmatimonadetes bacterium]|nr:SMP-30/gluconolactonase/LRE family protein [Gemmatimonadota bacterium]
DELIVSQYGGMEPSAEGSLALFDVETGALRVLYPDPTAVATAATDPDAVPTTAVAGAPRATREVRGVPVGARWGEADCAEPSGAAFAPHGIDLRHRADGRLALYVVNHAVRESVEMFEVIDASEPRLVWRGCVAMPPQTRLNDVVVLEEGGFLATYMYPGNGEVAAMIKGRFFDRDTGYVVEWSPERGHGRVTGSDAPLPNGIEISPDERYVYVGTWLGGDGAGVRRIDRVTAEVRRIGVGPVDNLAWSDDGWLLAAVHVNGVDEIGQCARPGSGACAMRTRIVAIDPALEQAHVLLEQAGEPMGGITVARQSDDRLWLGSFASDRIGVARYRPPVAVASR